MPMDIRASLSCTGDVDVITVQDPDEDANSVMEIEKPWAAEVHWYVDGGLAYLLAGADWHVKLIVESMGTGQENTLADVTVPGSSAMATLTGIEYRQSIDIPARDLANPQTIQEEGVYKLVTIVTHDKPFPAGTKDRVAGFNEGLMLQFYKFDLP